MSIAAYRHLLRATRIAFQGDFPLLTAARHEAKSAFVKNASLQASDPALAPAIAHAEEVAKILKENVVQGKKIEGSEEDTFKLRMHKHTERGDNDTVKDPRGGGTITIDGKKCSDP